MIREFSKEKIQILNTQFRKTFNILIQSLVQMQTLLILHSLTSEKLSSGKQMRANVGEDAEVRMSYTLLIEI